MIDKARKRLHDYPVEQEAPKGLPFVVKRREITADFDERQKQLFDQALIAILVADLSPDKVEKVLAAARDTTIQVFSGELLAAMNTTTQPECSRDEPPTTADSVVPALLSCTSCHGYSLILRGKFVSATIAARFSRSSLTNRGS
jgi:hypothetical protein